MSAAFDTVEYEILIDRLHTAFGVGGFVVVDGVFNPAEDADVAFPGQESTKSAVHCGVPQGSVLGRELFLLYTADMTTIADQQSLGIHRYANTQLCIDVELILHRT